jgi:hypothetical protein
MATQKKTPGAKRKAQTTGRKKSLGRKTVRSSNRQRAARAGQSDKVVPGRRHEPEPQVIDADSDQEVYGVMLSERRRRGESKPAVPESKTQNTRSREAKRPPAKTGIASRRKRT